MPIISNSPRTSHQQSQLAAKIARRARDNTKAVTPTQVNRVFGAGLYDAPEAAPEARKGKPARFVPSEADRAWWASESARLIGQQFAREAEVEREAWEEVRESDRAAIYHW